VSSTRLKNPTVRHVLSLDGVTGSSAGGDVSSDVGDVSVKRSVCDSVGGSSGYSVPVVCAWRETIIHVVSMLHTAHIEVNARQSRFVRSSSCVWGEEEGRTNRVPSEH
jgi:hypothetical protein